MDKKKTASLRTQSVSGPHGEEGEWAVSSAAPRPRLEIVEKLLMDEMLGLCAVLHAWATLQTRPHLRLMGSRCAALQGERVQKRGMGDSDALSLLFPLKNKSRRENYT